jgi:hypothetical protein
MKDVTDPTVWSQFGFPGLIIGALFYALFLLHKSMREERSEWINAYKEQTEKYDLRQAETNACIREMTKMVEVMNDRSLGRTVRQAPGFPVTHEQREAP